MNKKEWLIWLTTVFLIILAATLPIFTAGINQRWTLFEFIKYLWWRLFDDIGWWPLVG